MELKAPGCQLHGQEQKEICLIQAEKIGALPHVAEAFAFGKSGNELPVMDILALKENDGASVLFRTAAQDTVVAAVLLIEPDLGIPEILFFAAFRKLFGNDDGVVLIFDVICAVPIGQALGLADVFFSVFVRHSLYGGIH